MRRRMRGRVLGAELAIVLAALVFAETGVILLELRTDRILDWFISLVPLIWIDLSVLFLYVFLRLYFSARIDSPASEGGWARAFPGPLLVLAVMCPACASGAVSGLVPAYVEPIAFMGGIGAVSAVARLLGFSTLLLIATLALFWIVIAFITNVVLPNAPLRT